MSRQSVEVLAIGEILIDFVAEAASDSQELSFTAYPGGAPCNVLAALAKCHRRTAFVGRVGMDMFGRRLRLALEEAGISTAFLCEDRQSPTTLAFVKNGEDGERSFSFYRENTADTKLSAGDLPPDEVFTNLKIFHFGSLSFTDGSAREASLEALRRARSGGALISYDPNLRLNLWKDEEKARAAMREALPRVDLLKMAEEELEFLYESSVDEALNALRADYPQIHFLALTKGAEGSRLFYRGEERNVPAFLGLKSVDTTGAGDCYWGTLLNAFLEYREGELNIDLLQQQALRAAAAAALITTRKSALLQMPSAEETDALLTGRGVGQKRVP